jgi:hypothetical protein
VLAIIEQLFFTVVEKGQHTQVSWMERKARGVGFPLVHHTHFGLEHTHTARICVITTTDFYDE